MILAVDQVHRERLASLQELSVDVLQEYLTVSLEFIKSGPNQKVYAKAADKLKIAAEDVQNGIEALMYLYVESAKAVLLEDNFRDAITMLGFTGEIQQKMVDAYAENRHLIRKILTYASFDLCHYKDVEWRFDVVLGSRSLQHQMKSEILLRFALEENGNLSTVILQCDLSNLIHLTQTLEEALQELRSPHSNRILRNI